MKQLILQFSFPDLGIRNRVTAGETMHKLKLLLTTATAGSIIIFIQRGGGGGVA